MINFPEKKYNTIVIDPPWAISLTGRVKIRKKRAEILPYKTMSIQEIKEIPIICSPKGRFLPFVLVMAVSYSYFSY